ncbi:MAG: NAD-dependent epimerase/dehydratase family protein [Clostridia bacterium]|nr:NAD-dependent epimerase/dehydratase family protein [Clostridia bacterium]MEE1124926.1 NAD-dependent epimerase/dehydratase family protein [Acutalibacteraceae bacterium]
MKILVTGGTTFVSKYVAEYFVNKGNEVYVINRNTREQVDGVVLIEGDRMNLDDKLKNLHFDVVVDTAYNKEQVSTLVNSIGSFNDYIFISSSAVYPETNPQPFTEKQICGKNSVWGDYGINKLEAEKYLQENVKQAYILRPPYFYGVYENLHREALPFDCAMANRKFYLPENEMKLQFFNVFDLCRFIEILLEKHPENKIFNVGNKEAVTIKQWVELCYKVAGKTPEFVTINKNIAQRDYFCFYDYNYYLDVAKQYELMPETMDLEKGLKEQFEWYKNNIDSVYNRKPYFEYIDKNLANN